LWERLLAAHPDPSFFQTPRFAALARRAYGTPSRLFCVELPGGELAALPARRAAGSLLRPDWVSPGGGLPGGPLSEAPFDSARMDAFLSGLARHPNASFRLSLDPRDSRILTPRASRTLFADRFFVLDLRGGFETVYRDRFAKDVREQCRKAKRRGVEVRSEPSRRGFRDFAALHAAAAAAWDVASRQPAALFEALAELATAPDRPVDLLLARSREDGDRLVAGVLVARGPRTHTCWLAAMDRRARRLAASVAAYRGAVEAACDAGAERLLLGASAGIASIEAFKRSLGAEAIEGEHQLEVRGRLRQGIRHGRRLGRWVQAAAGRRADP
jgi:hypothetical protein